MGSCFCTCLFVCFKQLTGCLTEGVGGHPYGWRGGEDGGNTEKTKELKKGIFEQRIRRTVHIWHICIKSILKSYQQMFLIANESSICLKC